MSHGHLDFIVRAAPPSIDDRTIKYVTSTYSIYIVRLMAGELSPTSRIMVFIDMKELVFFNRYTAER